MSKSESSSVVEDTYYECTPCDYTASVDIAIGMCPLCGDRLAATSRFE